MQTRERAREKTDKEFALYLSYLPSSLISRFSLLNFNPCSRSFLICLSSQTIRLSSYISFFFCNFKVRIEESVEGAKKKGDEVLQHSCPCSCAPFPAVLSPPITLPLSSSMLLLSLIAYALTGPTTVISLTLLTALTTPDPVLLFLLVYSAPSHPIPLSFHTCLLLTHQRAPPHSGLGT